MGNYKLVALDMDGTVLDEQKNISPANKKAIRAALEIGVKVMFATGRGSGSAMPYIKELELDTPLVAVNGSEVYLSPEHLYSRRLLAHDHVLELRELALQHDVWYWAYSVEGVVNKENWETNMSTEWLKFGFYTEQETILTAIRDEVQATQRFEVSNSHPCNIELNPKGVNKATGLREICTQMGIGMHQVIAIGDSLNDLEMIRACGLGVAMGNAQEEVKRAADQVTLTNEEDGVAQVLAEAVLGSGS